MTESPNTAVRVFSFHGDQIVTLEHDGVPVVAMRQIAENMGLNWPGQHAKLLEQKEKFMCMDIHTHDVSGRLQKMLRDVLDRCTLIYNSPMGGFTLAF